MEITTTSEAYIICSLCGGKHILAPASSDPSGNWEAPIYASCDGFIQTLKVGDEVEIND